MIRFISINALPFFGEVNSAVVEGLSRALMMKLSIRAYAIDQFRSSQRNRRDPCPFFGKLPIMSNISQIHHFADFRANTLRNEICCCGDVI
jgi:hypothetical protein